MKASTQMIFPDTHPVSWAEVILPLAIPMAYTYQVPPGMESKALPGCRAEVVFGKQKKYAAIIRQIIQTAPAYETKPLLNILDDEPIICPEQLALWNWIADYYMCTEGEVMTAALPANFKLSSETILMFNEEAGEDFSGLDEEEFLVAEALLLRKQLQMTEVQQILDSRHVYPVIKRLM
ncbi:MAG TPA: primosomal protein N', partial [Ferruginibacter sp.]|nr:primosomal protein N' [Ferruginibacter sp.]